MKNKFSKVLAVLGIALIAAFAFLISPSGVSTEVVTAGGFGLGTVNPNLWDRGALFLKYLETSGSLPAKLVEEMASGAKVLDQHAYYVKVQIGTSGRVKVIDTATTIKKVGTTNLDRGVIEPGTFHLITDISVKYAAVATVTDPSLVIMNNFVYDNTTTYAVGTPDLDAGAASAQSAAVAVQRIPTKLYASEFKMLAGTTLIQEGSMSDLFVQNINGVGINGEYAFALRQPKLVAENQVISFDIEFPNNSETMDAGKNHFVELKLIGLRIRNRG